MAEYRDPPVTAPRPYGLFSVEPPTQMSDGPWATGAEWEPEGCALPLNYANALCTNPGTNEVQTSTITGTPTGGTFTLSFFGETTAPIAYNANAAAVQSALNALTNVDSGDVVVSGGPGPGTAFTYTFGGRYASRNVPQFSATGSFTGGTTPTIATATTTPGVQTAKVASGPIATAASGDAFSVYALRECRTVGEVARAQARAMSALTLNEEAAVEKEFWTRVSATATNITPGTPPAPEVGLAMLEEAIGDNYAGRPVIHASLNLASILTTKSSTAKVGQHLETGIGSYFVAGRGYPRIGPGGAPAAGSEWLIATGGIFIQRGTANVRGPFLVQQPLDNTQMTLAERTYVVGVDCQAVAIRVTFP